MATDNPSPGVGYRLLALLSELQAAAAWDVTSEPNGAGSEWRLRGTTWDATVKVDPTRWLGLQFEARDSLTGKRAHYSIDTDAYPIAKVQDRDFAYEIERDIIEFIENLQSGAVLHASQGSKLVLVFPAEGAYKRIVAGRFLHTGSSHVELAAAQGDGEYVSVV